MDSQLLLSRKGGEKKKMIAEGGRETSLRKTGYGGDQIP